jgi:hypothetical protein
MWKNISNRRIASGLMETLLRRCQRLPNHDPTYAGVLHFRYAQPVLRH